MSKTKRAVVIMSKTKRAVVLTFLEWGIDRPEMFYRPLTTLLKSKHIQEQGWEEPAPEDFENARLAELKDFVDPAANYWVADDHGDARVIQPKTGNTRTCNSFEIANRVRLVRKIKVTHMII